jgi:hypothetical protein
MDRFRENHFGFRIRMITLPIGCVFQLISLVSPYWQGGFVPLSLLPGLYPGPAGDLKRPPDPSHTHAPPNHKSWIPGGQSPPEALGILGITDIYLNDNFEPTTPCLSDQKNLILIES